MGGVVFSPDTLLELVTENALDDDTIHAVLKTAVSQRLNAQTIPPDSELGIVIAYAVDFPQLRETIVPRELLVDLAHQTISKLTTCTSNFCVPAYVKLKLLTSMPHAMFQHVHKPFKNLCRICSFKQSDTLRFQLTCFNIQS